MIRLTALPADPAKKNKAYEITTFTSYAFDRSVLTPAAAFRFTAPGVDQDTRLAIRSGDVVRLYADNSQGQTKSVGVGFIDETDTHITASSLEYSVTGRDVVSQLVDNDAVDVDAQMVFFARANINALVSTLLKDTRMMGAHLTKQLDTSAQLAVQTNPGETKITVLQRYLEWLNGLVWANNDGQLIVDKPNFAQKPNGALTLKYSDPSGNNLLEARVKRNINQAIRRIVTVLNGTEASAATVGHSTLANMDTSLKPYRGTNVGRSIMRTFDYANGADTLNQGLGLAKGSYEPQTIARAYSAREIAKENMHILDIEVVVEGHFNEFGALYDVDQVYRVTIEDENVAEPLYVYSVSYELTIDHGMITRMRLCRLYTICAYTDMFDRVVSR
jgi:prophage tail gpP-like protein